MRRKKCSCSGAERTEADIVEFSSPFLFISSLVLSKSPLLLCVSPLVFSVLRWRACQLRGKELHLEGVGCKLVRTSEEKKRKPRLETGSERGIEGEIFIYEEEILAIPRIPTHRYRLSCSEEELASRCAGWVVRFCRRVHR